MTSWLDFAIVTGLGAIVMGITWGWFEGRRLQAERERREWNEKLAAGWHPIVVLGTQVLVPPPPPPPKSAA